MTPPIIFCQQDASRGAFGNGQICAINFDGTGFVQMTADTNDYNWVRWSKDGSQILAADSSNRLWIFSAAGSLVRQITNFGDGGDTGFCQGDWSPDDSQIVILGTVYGTGGSATADLQIVNTDNSGHTPVALTERMSLYANAIISWAPDNTRFLYAGTNPDGAFGGVNYGILNATSCLLDGSGPVHILAGVHGVPNGQSPGSITYVPWRWYSDSTNVLAGAWAHTGARLPVTSLLQSNGATTTTLYADTTDDTFDPFGVLGAMDPTESKFVWNQLGPFGIEGMVGGIASAFYTTPHFTSSDGLDWRPALPIETSPPLSVGPAMSGVVLRRRARR